MRWQGGRRSRNIDDRRGGGFGGGFGGSGLRIPIGRAGAGGGIGLLVVLGLMLFFGVDPGALLQGGGPAQTPSLSRSGPSDDAAKDFMSVVLADTEDVWGGLFRAAGRTYEEPTLTLFSGAVESACGFAQSASGPFYCPADRKVYLDLSFFDDMGRQLGAPGDFAAAYVIAHEVGHHVQNLLGVLPQAHRLQQELGGTEANAISVRVELQADCYAGVWAHHTQTGRNIVLEAGDIEEGLNAAAAVGDDRLQSRAGGAVVPDSFTHGSSADRARWFRRGLDSGDLNACDTFQDMR